MSIQFHVVLYYANFAIVCIHIVIADVCIHIVIADVCIHIAIVNFAIINSYPYRPCHDDCNICPPACSQQLEIGRGKCIHKHTATRNRSGIMSLWDTSPDMEMPQHGIMK